MAKKTVLTPEVRQHLSEFLALKAEMQEVVNEVKRSPPLKHVSDLVAVSATMNGQEFGHFMEGQMCSHLGWAQSTNKSDPDGVDKDGVTYEVKSSCAYSRDTVNIVQYRAGKTDFVAIFVVHRQGIDYFLIPDKECQTAFRWSAAHGKTRKRDQHYEERVTLRRGSKEYESLKKKYLVKTYKLTDEL